MDVEALLLAALLDANEPEHNAKCADQGAMDCPVAAELREVAAKIAPRVSTAIAAPTVEEARTALVLSLAVDGYIDIDAMDAEEYLHGDASAYEIDQIEAVAASLHRFLVMDPVELEAQRAKVLARRHEEGRD